jgi:hypothetical protein
MQHPDKVSLSYRVATRLFESAFTACERLSDAERVLLMREMGARILQIIEKSTIPTEDLGAAKITGISVKVEEG